MALSEEEKKRRANERERRKQEQLATEGTRNPEKAAFTKPGDPRQTANIQQTTDPAYRVAAVNEARRKQGLPLVTAEQLALAGDASNVLQEVGRVKEQKTEEFLGEVTEAEAQLAPSPIAEEFGASPIPGTGETRSNLFVPESPSSLLNNFLGFQLGKKKLEAMEAAGINPLPAIINEHQAVTVSKLDDAKTRLLGDIDIFGLKTEALEDFFTGREDVDKLQTAIAKVGTIASSLEGITTAQGITPAQSVARLNQLEDDLDLLEERIQQAKNQNNRVRIDGKQFDIALEIQDQRTSIEDARATALEGLTQFNPDITQLILERLQNEQ